jgi:hypothetical protein
MGLNKESADLLTAYVSLKGMPAPSPQVVAHRGREYLLIPSDNGNILVMLNARYPSFYKQLPAEAGYALSHDFLYHDLISKHSISRTVVSVFDSRSLP